MNKSIKEFLTAFLMFVGTGVLIGVLAFASVTTLLSLVKGATYFGVW